MLVVPTHYFLDIIFDVSLYLVQHQGFCFGFVEFESLDSMQSAIKVTTTHFSLFPFMSLIISKI